MAAPSGLVCALLLQAALNPQESRAQRTDFRNITVAYEPGNASQNGYADAQLLVRYQVANCSRVSILPQAAATPSLLVAPHRYWVDGREVQVPPQFAVPRLTTVPSIRGSVRGRGINKALTLQWSTVAPEMPGCFVEDNGFADQREVWEQGATDEMKTAAMREIAFHPSGNLPPLRNQQVEEHFRAIWRQARADSAARANQQQRDSVARAQQHAAAERRAAEEAARQAQAAPQSSASAPQGSPGSTPASGNAATGGQTGGQTASPTVGQVVPAPPGVTAPYARDNSGGYWVRLPDGRYQEVTEHAYNAAREQEQQSAEAQRQAAAEEARQQEQARQAEAARQAAEAELREAERVEAREQMGGMAGAMVQDAISTGSRFGVTWSSVTPRSGTAISTVGLSTNFGSDFTYFTIALGTDMIAYLMAEEGTQPELTDDANLAFQASMITGVKALGMVVENWGLMPVVELGIVTGVDPDAEEVSYGDMLIVGGGVIARMGGLDVIATLSPFMSTKTFSIGMALKLGD